MEAKVQVKLLFIVYAALLIRSAQGECPVLREHIGDTAYVSFGYSVGVVGRVDSDATYDYAISYTDAAANPGLFTIPVLVA